MRYRLATVFIAFLSIIGSVPSDLNAQEPSPLAFVVDEQRVRERIDRTVIEHGVPSISVAAAMGRSEIWSYASGLAEKETQTLATPSTSYRLASVSKPITAVAIMLLADRGVIDLDAPANDYLGEQKILATAGRAEDVSIRRLMSHRGGLPLHYNLIHDGENYQRRSLDETIARYGIAMLPPGLTHRYSNVGYSVLERILEIQAGKSFSAFLQDELFDPLAMPSAGVFAGPVNPPGAAIPYTRSGDPYPAYDIDTRGAGGLYMTASDLVRFGRFFSDALHGRSPILSAESAKEMLETQHPSDEGDLEWYVLGWVHELRGEAREYDTIYHLGSTPGARAELWIFPDQELVVATLLNEMSYAPLNSAREAVLEAIIPDKTYRPYTTQQPYRVFDLPEELQRSWAGTISFGPDGTFSVEADLRLPDGPVLRIEGEEVEVYSLRTVDDGLVEIKAEAVDFPTVDTRRQPFELGFMLFPGEERLAGYVAANRIQADRNRDSGNFAFPVDMKPKLP